MKVEGQPFRNLNCRYGKFRTGPGHVVLNTVNLYTIKWIQNTKGDFTNVETIAFLIEDNLSIRNIVMLKSWPITFKTKKGTLLLDYSLTNLTGNLYLNKAIDYSLRLKLIPKRDTERSNLKQSETIWTQKRISEKFRTPAPSPLCPVRAPSNQKNDKKYKNKNKNERYHLHWSWLRAGVRTVCGYTPTNRDGLTPRLPDLTPQVTDTEHALIKIYLQNRITLKL